MSRQFLQRKSLAMVAAIDHDRNLVREGRAGTDPAQMIAIEDAIIERDL